MANRGGEGTVTSRADAVCEAQAEDCSTLTSRTAVKPASSAGRHLRRVVPACATRQTGGRAGMPEPSRLTHPPLGTVAVNSPYKGARTQTAFGNPGKIQKAGEDPNDPRPAFSPTDLAFYSSFSALRASSTPGNLSLNRMAIWSDFFASSLSPFFMLAIPRW